MGCQVSKLQNKTQISRIKEISIDPKTRTVSETITRSKKSTSQTSILSQKNQTTQSNTPIQNPKQQEKKEQRQANKLNKSQLNKNQNPNQNPEIEQAKQKQSTIPQQEDIVLELRPMANKLRIPRAQLDMFLNKESQIYNKPKKDILQALEIEFESNKKCPKVEQFMKDFYQNIQEEQNILQRKNNSYHHSYIENKQKEEQQTIKYKQINLQIFEKMLNIDEIMADIEQKETNNNNNDQIDFDQQSLYNPNRSQKKEGSLFSLVKQYTLNSQKQKIETQNIINKKQ